MPGIWGRCAECGTRSIVDVGSGRCVAHHAAYADSLRRLARHDLRGRLSKNQYGWSLRLPGHLTTLDFGRGYDAWEAAILLLRCTLDGDALRARNRESV